MDQRSFEHRVVSQRQAMRATPDELLARVEASPFGPKSKEILRRHVRHESTGQVGFALFECPPAIVRGEGALVYDADGKLRSNALSTYKVPDIYSIPKEIAITPLETTRDNLAIFNSKAVGEPPLMYGLGAYFAIRNAVRAFVKNPPADAGGTAPSPDFDLPFTPEKVLMNLYASSPE